MKTWKWISSTTSFGMLGAQKTQASYCCRWSGVRLGTHWQWGWKRGAEDWTKKNTFFSRTLIGCMFHKLDVFIIVFFLYTTLSYAFVFCFICNIVGWSDSTLWSRSWKLQVAIPRQLAHHNLATWRKIDSGLSILFCKKNRMEKDRGKKGCINLASCHWRWFA